MNAVLMNAVAEQQPHRAASLGRHVDHRLAVCGQLLGQGAAKAAGALHGPVAFRPPLGPAAQVPVAGPGGGEPLLVNQLPAVIQRGGGTAVLVGVDPEGHAHADTLLGEAAGRTEGGQPDFEQCSPL